MLGGRNQDSLFHQAGCVADPRDVPADRFHVETIQIDAAEDDSGSCCCRQYAQVNRRTAVEANSLTFGCCAKCLFGDQNFAEVKMSRLDYMQSDRFRLWQISHS